MWRVHSIAQRLTANEGKEAGEFSARRAKVAAEKDGKLLTGRTTISVAIVTCCIWGLRFGDK